MYMYDIPQNAELFADSNRGVYIPQYFAESVMRELVSGVSDNEWATLEAGPDHEFYWDTWNDVEQNAVLKDKNGKTWKLYHEGDLWLIPD